MNKKAIYIETTILSYLVSRSSSEVKTAAMQQMTSEWWSLHRKYYDIFVSDVTIEEISLGDKEQSDLRMSLIKEIPVLGVTYEIRDFSKDLIKDKIIPEKAKNDALHICCAALNGIDVLLTWNCKHLANPFVQDKLMNFFYEYDLKCPLICTPLELIEGVDNED